jgi:uncharacterized membrane protein (DUF2068 family)
MRDALGLRIIVSYKFVKALAEVALGALLLSPESAGVTADLHGFAIDLQHHAAAGWSLALAGQLVHVTIERSVRMVGLAMFLDGLLSAIEGWALYRCYRWSRWFIVGTTSCLLPFEAVELARHVSTGRLALLAMNALIVAYLLRSLRDRSRRS